MASRRIRVCVIIPAYNEGSVIREVVQDVSRALKHHGYVYEVVVVDDGSTDATVKEALAGGARIIKHLLNSGAGAATATGLSYANQKGFYAAATMDGDGQHLASDVVNGFKKLEASESDLLIGSRLIDSRGMSKVKILGNRGLSFITYLIFGINSTDSQSGLRVFSRKSLETLRWKTSGYEFASEMLWRAKQLRLKIDDFPVKAVYSEYSRSKGQNNWNAINIIKSLLKRRIMEFLG